MPMTATHATAGVLDVTADPMGGGLRWADVHRVRPRAPLRCRECGHGLHAKVSPRGLRFFAHDRGAPDCSQAGESIEHHLLKQELASAVRAAGWHAELEVPGDGWRADVLATSPDGLRRMAWEAQLSPIDVDEITRRTEQLHASGVRVCWVAHRERPWIGRVPSVLLEDVGTGETEEDEHQVDRVDVGRHDRSLRRELEVTAGLGTYHFDWCWHRGRCELLERRYGIPEPCPGHGGWAAPTSTVPLGRFVAGVLRGSVLPHRSPGGAFVWTTRPHLDKADEHAAGVAEHEKWAARQERLRRRGFEHQPYDAAEHQKMFDAKMQRQQSLLAAAVRYVEKNVGGAVSKSGRASDAFWAGGIPLRSHGRVQGVVSPVLSRISPEIQRRMRGVILFAADERERAQLLSRCGDRQRVVVLAVDRPRP